MVEPMLELTVVAVPHHRALTELPAITVISPPLHTPLRALALSSSLSQLIAAVFAMDAVTVASRATRCPAISAAALSCGPS
jgi:hypothetical protein